MTETTSDDHRLGPLAAAVTELVPAIVEALLASRATGVHRAAMAILERPLLAHMLDLSGGNQLRAARVLGLNRNTLRKRCRALQVSAPRAPRRRVPVNGGPPPAS
jgi:two-component system nitrogen regulation response regulator GlnG